MKSAICDNSIICSYQTNKKTKWRKFPLDDATEWTSQKEFSNDYFYRYFLLLLLFSTWFVRPYIQLLQLHRDQDAYILFQSYFIHEGFCYSHILLFIYLFFVVFRVCLQVAPFFCLFLYYFFETIIFILYVFANINAL